MLINFRGRLLGFSKPVIMGILNTTPDSFYKGSRLSNLDEVLERAEQMLAEGATILDIGGVSSRPGASDVSLEEELRRVIPVVEAISRHYPEALLSVDTFRAEVAKQAIDAGIHLVNDISASSIDEALFDVIANAKVPYILMHMQGTPKCMQQEPQYDDFLVNIMDFFIKKIGILRDKGIQDIILDVGFGFGKTIAHNYELLNNMHVYQNLDLPLMAGISRKSMIWKVLGNSSEEALNGTTALHMVALQQGAKMLRVHDVKEAAQTIKIWQQLEKYQNIG
jgi:dihydropteroate synthase